MGSDTTDTTATMEADWFEFSAEHRVDPDSEGRFRDAMARLMAAERRQRGFLSHSGPTPTARGTLAVYTTHSRWRDLESWLAWMDSAERRAIVQHAPEDGYTFRGTTNWRGYAQWLAKSQARVVPTWKVNLLVLLVLYPSILLVRWLMDGWPLDVPSAVLLSTVATVALTGWWLVPVASRIYAAWLEGRQSRWRAAFSLASILALVALTWLAWRSLPPGVF